MSSGLATALGLATAVCVAANLGMAIADFSRAKFVLRNSAEVGLSLSAIPYLGILKVAGAIGLAVGFLGPAWLGLAAGIGLVLFFIGAVGAHLRARVLYNIAFPLTYLLLALCASAYFVHAIG